MSSDPFSNLPPDEADDDRTVIRPPSRTGAGAPAAPAEAPRTGSPTTIPGRMGGEVVAGANAGNGDHGNTLPVGTYVGEFEVTDVLGEGGFGIVYLAWDHSLERKVALKEYMPSSLAARGAGLGVTVKSSRHQETFEAGRRSFVNEAKLLAQFDHPSMVKVYRFWEANGTAYMVMPFYEGSTLKDTLKEMGSPPDEAWLTALLAPVSEALEVLHNQQCYHRDIAPDNIILLKGSGKPLLLDFGAARRVIGDMTQALTVILKAGYAPIEQYAEVPGMNQGPWTDVYALAASVYYAIHGKTPPPAVGRLVNDGYVPLVQSAAGRYSERFLAAIDHALAVKPDERTQNMAQLRDELGVASGYVPPTVMPSPHGGGATAGRGASAPADARTAPRTAAPQGKAHTTAAPGGDAPKSKLPLIIGGAVVAVAALGGIGYAVMGGKPASPAPADTSASAPASAATTVAAAPTATLPPAEDAAPTGPFDPVKELQRIVTAGSAGFTVEATATKPTFKIGKDRLSFSFTSSKPGYAYVLLVSTDGTFMKLFPNRIAQHNRITEGEHITLPHASWPMDVAGPAGVDHFVVIVSTNPRDFSAVSARSEGGFVEFPIEQAEAAWRAHRGPGSVFAGQVVCDNGSACSEEYGAATFSLQEVD